MRMYDEYNKELCLWIKNEKLNLMITEEDEVGDVSNVIDIELNKTQMIKIKNYLDNYLNKEIKLI